MSNVILNNAKTMLWGTLKTDAAYSSTGTEFYTIYSSNCPIIDKSPDFQAQFYPADKVFSKYAIGGSAMQSDKVYFSEALSLQKIMPKKQEGDGELRDLKNNIYLNAIRVSVKGALGLRSPVFYPQKDDKCPTPCGVPLILTLVAYDLDNKKIPGKNEAYHDGYFVFWQIEFPFSNYDIYEPINEQINAEYIDQDGKKRIAKNYRIGIIASSSGEQIHINYDSFGIPDAYSERIVSLEASLDADYIP